MTAGRRSERPRRVRMRRGATHSTRDCYLIDFKLSSTYFTLPCPLKPFFIVPRKITWPSSREGLYGSCGSTVLSADGSSSYSRSSSVYGAHRERYLAAAGR